MCPAEVPTFRIQTNRSWRGHWRSSTYSVLLLLTFMAEKKISWLTHFHLHSAILAFMSSLFYADINECLNFRVCSHLCNNTKGSYMCTCAKNFQKTHHMCKAEGTGNGIRRGALFNMQCGVPGVYRRDQLMVGLNEIWTDRYRITSFAYPFLRVFLNVKKPPRNINSEIDSAFKKRDVKGSFPV